MIEVISGKVSMLQFSSETTGQIGGSGGRVSGNIHTKQVITFRVDGRPAQIKLAGQPSLTEGDNVVLAGNLKNGTFHARAMRNDSTGAIDHQPSTGLIALGAVMIALGVVLLVVLVGVLFIGFGTWNVYQGLQNRKSVALVQAAPRKG